LAQESDLRVEYAFPTDWPQGPLTVNVAAGDKLSSGFALDLFVVNDSDTPIEYAAIELSFDADLEVEVPPNTKGLMSDEAEQRSFRWIPGELRRSPVKVYTIHWHVAERLPIFKGYRQRIFVPSSIIRVKADKAFSLLAWEIIVPGLPSKSGQISLTCTAAGLPSTLQNGGPAEVYLQTIRRNA